MERVRVEAARRRLEESSDKLAKVAQDCGFGSLQSLRRSFLRILRVSANDYRLRFKDPGADPTSSHVSVVTYPSHPLVQSQRLLGRNAKQPSSKIP